MVIALIAMVAVVMLVMAFVVSMSFVFAIVMAVIFVTVVLMCHVMSVNVVAVIFYFGMFFMAFFSGMLLMAHFPAFFIPFMSAVRNFVSMVFMLPDIMMFRVATDGIRMDVFVAVDPCALPRRVIDEHHATVPGNAVISPSPWPI